MGAITWYRNNRILVADLASETWTRFRRSEGLTEVAATEHIERAAAAGRATRLARGIYLMEEETRPADPLVVASQLYEDTDRCERREATPALGNPVTLSDRLVIWLLGATTATKAG